MSSEFTREREFEREQLWRQSLVARLRDGSSTEFAVQTADAALAAFDARFPLPPGGKAPSEWPPVADGEDE